MIMKFVSKKNTKTKVFENNAGTLVSKAFRSFDNLFNILPNGTLSKNSFNEEKSKLLIID